MPLILISYVKKMNIRQKNLLKTYLISVMLQCTILEGGWHRDESVAGRGEGIGRSSKQRLPCGQRTDQGDLLKIAVIWNIMLELINFKLYDF